MLIRYFLQQGTVLLVPDGGHKMRRQHKRRLCNGGLVEHMLVLAAATRYDQNIRNLMVFL